jgi:hypothetical protein
MNQRSAAFKLISLLVAFQVMFGLSSPAFAGDQDFRFTVLEAYTLEPVAGASIDFYDSNLQPAHSFESGSTGEASMTVPPGIYTIKVKYSDGFETVIPENFYSSGPYLSREQVFTVSVFVDVQVSGRLTDNLGRGLPFFTIYETNIKIGETDAYGYFNVNRTKTTSSSFTRDNSRPSAFRGDLMKFSARCQDGSGRFLNNAACDGREIGIPGLGTFFTPFARTNYGGFIWSGLTRSFGSTILSPPSNGSFSETYRWRHAVARLEPAYPAVGEQISCSTSYQVSPYPGYMFIIPGKRTLQTGASNTYTISEEDAGERISCLLQAKVPLTGWDSVQSNEVNAATIVPLTVRIEGENRAGKRLSVNTGPWLQGIEFTYRWFKNLTPLEGFDEATYMIRPEDVGHAIKVEVTGSKQGFLDASEFSNVVIPWEGDMGEGTVSFQGVQRVGEAVCASTQGWEVGTSFVFKWMVGWRELQNSTENCYTLQESDLNTEIKVLVTASRSGFLDLTKQVGSFFVSQGVQAALVNIQILGICRVGSTLSASSPKLAPNQTLRFSWHKNGIPVSGATQTQYQIRSQDLEQSIDLKVISEMPGYENTSLSVGGCVIQTGQFSQTDTPKIFSRWKFSVGTHVDLSSGNWDNNAALKIRWLRGSVPIPGAIGYRYLLTAKDYGHRISASVTGTLPGYETIQRVSLDYQVLLGRMNSKPPTLVGMAKNGQTIRGNVAKWVTGASVEYQWLLSGKAIGGATKPYLILPKSSKGKTIQLKVTQKSRGYGPSTATSKSLKIR